MGRIREESSKRKKEGRKARARKREMERGVRKEHG